MWLDVSAPPGITVYLCVSQMQIYMYNSDDFDSLSAALREKRIIAAMAVFFQVGFFFLCEPFKLFYLLGLFLFFYFVVVLVRDVNRYKNITRLLVVKSQTV